MCLIGERPGTSLDGYNVAASERCGKPGVGALNRGAFEAKLSSCTGKERARGPGIAGVIACLRCNRGNIGGGSLGRARKTHRCDKEDCRARTAHPKGKPAILNIAPALIPAVELGVGSFYDFFVVGLSLLVVVWYLAHKACSSTLADSEPDYGVV